MASLTITIPQELFAPAESSHFEGTYDLPVMKAGPDLYTFSAPVEWQVDITNTGEALLLQGTCEGEAVTACARCGESALVSLFGELEGYYFLEAETAADQEYEADECEVLPESHVIELSDKIQAAFILDVPYIPLCKDDCQGLCPECGANLNEGPCGCEKPDEPVKENAFAVLKDLKLDN